MIPTLLWRCPLCATDDALEQIARRLRGDLVRCRACGAEWRVRRVPGDNFYLKLTRDGSSGGDRKGAPLREASDDERSITAWYDAMKATVHLAPIHDPALALLPGETLYLASGPVELQAEETDPLFFPPRSGIEALAGLSGQREQPAKASTPGEDLHIGRVDKRGVRGKTVGVGRLFLTDRRLIWQGEAGACAFPLARLNSALALLDEGLVLMVEMRLYTVRFLRESLLKWVTHIALIAPQVEAATGHRIATSHF